MNRNKLILIAVLLLLIWPAWWLTNRVTPSIDAPSSAPGQSSKTSTPAPDATGQQSIRIPSAEERAISAEEKQQRYLEKARSAGKSFNRPGNFYGRILDQNDQPVMGVTIKCGLSYFGDLVLPGLKPHYDQFERTTDADGRFSVEGQSGLSLDLRLQPKPGYEFRPTGLGVTLRDIALNQPAPTLSMPDKPYIFRAFRKGQAEALLKGEIAFYDCEPDGRSYLVQLKSNHVVEGTTGGDFRISVQRPPGWTNQIDYDWAVRIDAVGMELVETHDVFMYQAPASGYESSWNFSKKAGEEDYTREVDPKFYLKSRDGAAYGRMELRIKSNSREKSAILIYYWLNPSGSRNLEYDPLQNVAKPPPAAKP